MKLPGLLLACVVVATASLATVAVCVVLFTLRPGQVAVDGDSTTTGVADVVEHKYASGTLSTTSCPKLPTIVTPGTRFTCTIQLGDGTTEHVRATVNSDGGYDVDAPE